MVEGSPPVQPLYRHDWRSPGGWVSKFGPDDAPRLVDDTGSPSGRAKRLDRATTGGHYFSPCIALVEARTYCLDLALRWDGGAWPAVGLDLYGHDQAFLGERWLVGRPGLRTDLGDVVAAVPRDAVGWRTYRKAFTVPVEATEVRLKDQLAAAGTGKPGQDLAFLGPLTLHPGLCEPEAARAGPEPLLRRLLGLGR